MSEQDSPVRKSPGRTHANQEAKLPQQPSPRLRIHTSPIPARQTSIASETGSFVLRSPFVFGAFDTSTLPRTDSRHISELVQENIQAAYEADYNRFGQWQTEENCKKNCRKCL